MDIIDTVTFRLFISSFQDVRDAIQCGDKRILVDEKTRFELCGIVVARGVRGEKQVDDGTGVVECIRWLRDFKEFEEWDPPKFGQLAIVTGTIDTKGLTSKRKLSINKERFTTDPNEEILFWAEALKLGRDFYKIF